MLAHVTLANVTPQDSRDILDRVASWWAARPHLARPTVLHAVAFLPNECRHSCVLQLDDPTPADLSSLADAIAAWAWPDPPRLAWTDDGR